MPEDDRRSALRTAWVTLVLFWALVVGSIVVANLIYPGWDWYKPSLSHFGEAGAKTALAYNGMQVLAALDMAGFAIAFARACRPLERRGLRAWARWLLGAVFGLLGVSLATLALLPYNVGGRFGWPIFVVHNVAGWTEAVAPGAAIVLLPWLMPGLRRGFYAFSWACLVPLAVVWYAFVVAHSLAHGVTEMAAYGVLGVWSFALLAEVTRALKRAG
jgi:hypothetical membrane protein